MSNVLLTGLIFLPLLGNVASTLLWSYTRNQLFSWVPRGLSVGLVLAVAWVLRGQSFEQIIGGWQPVSLTGSPLILADNLSGHALLIAWVSVHFYEAYVRRNDSRDWRLTDGVIAGAIHLAVVVTAFAQNFVTLLIGLGLIDLLTELRALQSRQHEGRRNTNLLFMSSSLAMLTAGMVLHVAQYNSLYFPLARLGPQTANLLFIGLALRLWLLPIHTPQVSYLSVSSTASAALPGWIAHGLGTLLLIDQLSRVGLGAPPTVARHGSGPAHGPDARGFQRDCRPTGLRRLVCAETGGCGVRRTGRERGVAPRRLGHGRTLLPARAWRCKGR